MAAAARLTVATLVLLPHLTHSLWHVQTASSIQGFLPSGHVESDPLRLVIGDPPSGDKCCVLLEGLPDLEVAACLFTAIKANMLGINLNVPVALSACQKTIPPGLICV